MNSMHFSFRFYGHAMLAGFLKPRLGWGVRDCLFSAMEEFGLGLGC
jgi:hypothetical protein